MAHRLEAFKLMLLLAGAAAAPTQANPPAEPATQTASAPALAAGAQRRAVLDAVRPQAAKRTGQAVRIRVDRLNVDAGWALLVGELVAPGGGPLTWDQVQGCQPELDKGLWATLQRSAGRWQVRSLQVCAPEPPLWGGGAAALVLPCGVYAGLTGAEGQDLQALCLQRRARPSR